MYYENSPFEDQRSSREERAGHKKKLIVKAISVIVAMIAILTLFVSCRTIPAGHTGVVTKFGAVNDTVLNEGLHMVTPYVTKVVKMDNRVIRTDVDVNSASKDLQTVSSTISVNYRINPDSSAKLYKNVGKDYDTVIVRPAVQETTKAIVAQFTAEELITKRQSVSDLMAAALSEKINPYGMTIEVFNILNFDFSEEFNKAIEAKQTAQQQALKAEQDLQRVRVEAEQKVVQAQAEAETYKLQNQEITDKTLILKYLEKWDGKLPAVQSGDGQILDVSALLQN